MSKQTERDYIKLRGYTLASLSAVKEQHLEDRRKLNIQHSLNHYRPYGQFSYWRSIFYI